MEDSKINERSTKMWAVKHFHGLDVVSSRNHHIRLREDSREGSYICTSTESSSSALPEGIVNGTECSMCGDVGIYKDLFQCKRCLYRYQHLYCSRSYPNFGSEKWICDWCLHTERRGQPEKQQRANLKRKPASVKNNALEFLLQVAQSTPEAGNQADKVDRQISRSTETNLLGGWVPKRQRCSHAVEKGKLVALSRWRQIAKNRLQLNPSKGLGRRYKLLADVLC